jgi:hypothetical protein
MHIQRRSLLTDYLKIEALPNTTMPSSVDFSKIGKNVLKELALQSANRVFRSKDGKPIRILLCWNTGALLK